MPPWTPEYRALLLAFAAKFPIPFKTGAADAQAWTHQLAEQFRYTFGERFGHKQASPTRPHSADTIALREGAMLFGWDVLLDAGGESTLITTPRTIDLTGQVFEVVQPVNHVGLMPPPPPPPPTPPPLPTPPPPPVVDVGVATYDTSLQLETVVGRIRTRYREVHGRDAGWSDIGHNLWRWYREGRWTSLEDILVDIGQ